MSHTEQLVILSDNEKYIMVFILGRIGLISSVVYKDKDIFKVSLFEK